MSLLWRRKSMQTANWNKMEKCYFCYFIWNVYWQCYNYVQDWAKNQNHSLGFTSLYVIQQHLFHLNIFLPCPFPEENDNASVFDCSKPYGQETNTHYFCPLYFLNFIKELLVWQNVYSQCILMCKELALVMSDLRTWWILIWMFQAYDLDRHRTEAYIHAGTHIREGTEPNKLCDWSSLANITTLEFLNPSTQTQAMTVAQYITYCCAVDLRLQETLGA